MIKLPLLALLCVLALFYGGMVRKKNVLATLMQAFACTALVTACRSVDRVFAGIHPRWDLRRRHVASAVQWHGLHRQPGRQQAVRVASGADDSGNRLRHIGALLTGALLTGVFASKEISGMDGSVLTQAKGVAVTVVYGFVVS